MRAGHGTPARYRYGCRCAPCRYATSQHRYQPMPDPQPVIEHLRLLSQHGIGYRRAAELAGVGRNTTLRIMSGTSRPMARTAAALLAVAPTAPRSEGWPDAAGSRRRVQGLVALGWMMRDIAARTDVDPTGLSQLVRAARPGIQRATAARIAAVYDEMQWSKPEKSRWSNAAQARARRRSWFTPQAWDDETIDDPATLPCLLPPVEPVDRDLELLVQHLAAGHAVEPTTAAVREFIRRMPEAKNREIAAIIHRTSQWVSEVRTRMRAAAC